MNLAIKWILRSCDGKLSHDKVREMEKIMNLEEALLSAKVGNFVTNEYFDHTQSLHYYNGKYYYEDGAVVPENFLNSQDFAINSKWSIAIKKANIGFDKLKSMHDKNRGYMLSSGSYMDCRK